MADRRDLKNRILNKGEYQKSDGRYMYKFVDATGVDRFVYSWTLTQTDRTPKGKRQDKCLREKERDIARDLQDGIDSFNAQKLTLNAFFDEYISHKAELKPSTRTGYKYTYDQYIRGSLGRRRISEIKYSDIKRLYTHLYCDGGLKPGTIMGIQTVLHPLFKTAVRDSYIRTNPTEGVISELRKSFSWEIERRHALSEKEQLAFIGYVEKKEISKRWFPLFVFLLGTGCRIGEAIGLTWTNCDFRHNIITIDHTLTYKVDDTTRHMRYYVSAPKTKAGIREIPMFATVRDVLISEYKRQSAEGFCHVEVDGYSGFVFPNRNNGLLTPANINETIRRIIICYNEEELANASKEHREPQLLPRFSAHNLRHTFCTRLCEKDANIKVVQEIMGHTDIRTTMDVYNEATRDKKQEAFAELEGKICIC